MRLGSQRWGWVAVRPHAMITSQAGQPRGGHRGGASWPSIKQCALGGRAAWGSHCSTTFPKKPAVHLVYNAIHSKCCRGPFLWSPFPFAYSQGGVLHKGRRRDGLRQGQRPGGGCLGTAFSHSLRLLPRSTRGLCLSTSGSFPPRQHPRGSGSAANAL